MTKKAIKTGGRGFGKTMAAIEAVNAVAEGGGAAVFVNRAAAANAELVKQLHPDVLIISCFSPAPIWHSNILSGAVVVVHPGAWGVEITLKNLARMCDESEERGVQVIRNQEVGDV